MSAKIARCGHSVPYADGDQGPCDRVATGWRWYQDAEHEDLLEVACFLHENQGGNLMAALTDERDRARAIAVALEQELAEVRGRIARLIEDAEGGEGIVIYPGHSVYHVVETGLLRQALQGPA